MPVAPGSPVPQVTYCGKCGKELTAITRCEQDGHRSHHAQCCPSQRPVAPYPDSTPAPQKTPGLLGGLRKRK